MGNSGHFSGRVQQSRETVEPKKTVKMGLDEWQYLEDHETQDLFSVIKSKRDRAMFRLAYHRGLRAHEIGMLELAHFRERDGVLFCPRGKGSISREYALTNEELRCLRAWIKERGTLPGPLFPSRERRPISRSMLHRLMRKYCALAGISKKKAHMHALKHSCGTHLSERGAAPAEIQDWLGHRSSHSTDIYTHFTRRQRSAAAEKFKDWR